jgi:hypothetical protein
MEGTLGCKVAGWLLENLFSEGICLEGISRYHNRYGQGLFSHIVETVTFFI